jgi:hypothetical protein
MIRRLPHRTCLLLVRSRRNVCLAADDRLDPGIGRFLVKLDRAEKIAVISHGHGRHAEFDRFFHQLLHPHCTVQQRIFGVEVEVNKRVAGHRDINAVNRVQSNLPSIASQQICALSSRTNVRDS